MHDCLPQLLPWQPDQHLLTLPATAQHVRETLAPGLGFVLKTHALVTKISVVASRQYLLETPGTPGRAVSEDSGKARHDIPPENGPSSEASALSDSRETLEVF